MNVFDLEAKIGLDTKGFTSGLSSAKGAMTKASKAIGSGIKTASKVGIAAFIFGDIRHILFFNTQLKKRSPCH